MSITPEQAGWDYSGLHVIDRDCAIDLGDSEAVVLPLSARDIVVTVDGVAYSLRGRAGVFAAVSDWL
ncbi:MAG: 5-deoxy-glucuronate isomerase, partial [Actinomycetota bacterium]